MNPTPAPQTSLSCLKGIWSFFDRTDRLRFIWLYALMLVNGVLEVLGLAAIFPVISILTSTSWHEQWPQLGELQKMLGMSDRGEFAVLLMMLLFVYFLFRNSFRIWVLWHAFRLVCIIHSRLINRLVETILGQNYSWLSKRNSSQHLHLVQDDVGRLVGFLRNAVMFFAEATSTLGIVLLLAYSQPIVFILLIGFLAVPAYLFQRYFRSYLLRIGERIRSLNISTLTHLREVFGAIKEVKVTGSETYTTAMHSLESDERNRLDRNYAVINELPKIILENAFLGGMVVVVGLHVLFQDTVSGSLTYLGLLAIAGFRSVPVINKALGFLVSIKYCWSSINAIENQLQQTLVAERRSDKQLFVPFSQIRMDAVSFAYDNGDNQVLKSIDLTINKGEMIGIVGTSGSGKTTLVDVLLGLLEPTSGKVLGNGEDISLDLHQWRQLLGYVPQSTFLIDRDIRHNVAFATKNEHIDDHRVNKVLESAQLSDVVASLANGVYTEIGESGVRLSGGQRQRVGIARALYRNPQLLVLDEATSALDNATEARFMKVVETMKGQCTLIIIAHRLTTIAHCDRVYRLENGILSETKI